MMQNEEEVSGSMSGGSQNSRISSRGGRSGTSSPRLQRVLRGREDDADDNTDNNDNNGAARAQPRRRRGEAVVAVVEGDNNNDNNRRFDADRVLRCDIAKALMRCSGEAIVLNPAVDAPPFVVAFEMLEPTTIPKLLQDAVWVLNNIKSCTEKGEAGAYITGLPGLSVTLDPTNANKSVVRQTLADGSRTQINEVALQIRVQEVSAWVEERAAPPTTTTMGAEEEEEEEEAAAGRVEVRERFLLLVARSPLAFSLRKAAYTTTRSVGRLTLQDTRGADERRRVWAQLAMHVRAPLEPRMRGADLMEKFEPSMDWMRSSEADGFTCLFSMHRAVDWMKARFIAKHAHRFRFVSDLEIKGLAGRMSLPRDNNTNDNHNHSGGGGSGGGDDFLVGPGFVDECRAYDEEVDRQVILILLYDDDASCESGRLTHAAHAAGRWSARIA
jgi:hypothetical protein